MQRASRIYKEQAPLGNPLWELGDSEGTAGEDKFHSSGKQGIQAWTHFYLWFPWTWMGPGAYCNRRVRCLLMGNTIRSLWGLGSLDNLSDWVGESFHTEDRHFLFFLISHGHDIMGTREKKNWGIKSTRLHLFPFWEHAFQMDRMWGWWRHSSQCAAFWFG